MKTTRNSGILTLTILLIAMMTAVLPGAIGHADNNPPATAADAGDVYLPLVVAPDTNIPVSDVLRACFRSPVRETNS